MLGPDRTRAPAKFRLYASFRRVDRDPPWIADRHTPPITVHTKTVRSGQLSGVHTRASLTGLAAPGTLEVMSDNRKESVTDLAIFQASEPMVSTPATLSEAAKEYARRSNTSATTRAYARVWRAWRAWCAERGFAAIPCDPKALASYLSELAERGAAVGTIAHTLSIINVAHEMSGQPQPRYASDVKQIWKGIKKTHGKRPLRQARPLSPEELRSMVATGHGLAGVRDRAILLLGFAAALRRSELVALNVDDLAFDADGLVVTIRWSKVDQEGVGAIVGVRYGGDRLTCPVRAVREWLEVSGIREDAVFRSVRVNGTMGETRLSDRDVVRILARSAKRSGVALEKLSGHSLRSGLATTAAKAGKRMDSIMRQGRWTSVSTVQRYIRIATVLGDDNASGGIGL